jgi:uncharacterized protein (DUF2267 family)
MDELVKLVAQKTGLSEAQAKLAVTTVLDFIKQRLPAPVAAQVDTILNNPAGGIAGVMGGLFGQK